MKLLFSTILVAVFASSAGAVTGYQSSRSGGVMLRANTPTGAVLDPGDRISLEYQTAQDAAVIVFDIDTQGYVRLVSPTGELVRARAHETSAVPDDGSELVVEGEPGVEFLFAVAVDDPDAVDASALESLRDTGGTPRRIDGDPFIAANMIASELVQNVSGHAVFLGYTYFYVSERVDYPCYLCGTCDGGSTDTQCEGYRIVQDFDRRPALAYPLQRGYEMVELAKQSGTDESTPDSVALPDDDDDVIVNFYPYGSEVRYADPVAVNLWYDWGWYDPFFWYYPYYYPYSGWSFSIGFGWGWGWGWGWPGYYCSGWYYPYGGGCYYPYDGGYYPYNGSYAGTQKFKSKYKSGSNSATTLVANRTYASKRDGDLRVASKSVRPTATKPMSFRSKSSSTGLSRSESPRRVKTSVSGSRSVVRQTWSKGRATAGYRSGDRARSPSMYRTKGTTSGGRSVMQRNGTYRPSYRSKGGAVSPSRDSGRRSGATRVKPSSAPRGSSSAPSYRGGYKSSGGYRSGAAYRGGGGYRGSSGGAPRGGGTKSAPRGRGR